jgi:hypothetical protein
MQKPAIDDYAMLRDDFIAHLQALDLWTAEDQAQREQALALQEQQRLAEEAQEQAAIRETEEQLAALLATNSGAAENATEN